MDKELLEKMGLDKLGLKIRDFEPNKDDTKARLEEIEDALIELAEIIEEK